MNLRRGQFRRKVFNNQTPGLKKTPKNKILAKGEKVLRERFLEEFKWPSSNPTKFLLKTK